MIDFFGQIRNDMHGKIKSLVFWLTSIVETIRNDISFSTLKSAQNVIDYFKLSTRIEMKPRMSHKLQNAAM